MTAVLILFPRMSHHLKAQQQSASRSNTEEMSTHVTSVVRSHPSGLPNDDIAMEENPEIGEEKESPMKGKKLF